MAKKPWPLFCQHITEFLAVYDHIHANRPIPSNSWHPDPKARQFQSIGRDLSKEQDTLQAHSAPVARLDISAPCETFWVLRYVEAIQQTIRGVIGPFSVGGPTDASCISSKVKRRLVAKESTLKEAIGKLPLLSRSEKATALAGVERELSFTKFVGREIEGLPGDAFVLHTLEEALTTSVVLVTEASTTTTNPAPQVKPLRSGSNDVLKTFDLTLAQQSRVPGIGKRCRLDAPIADEEAQIIVRNYIDRREGAGERITAREVEEDCGIALGRVPKMTAWQAYQARRKRTPQVGKPRPERQLTCAILAAVGTENDPAADLMSKEEAAWNYLRKQARTAEEESRLNKMTPTEKAEAIQLVIDLFADQDKRGKRRDQ